MPTDTDALGVAIGDVIQAHPDHGPPPFGGCFAIVTELTPWGVRAAVRVPGPGPSEVVVPVLWGAVSRIGRAAWGAPPVVAPVEGTK
jgi:hypothetical protein